jgi:hypothetical protein
MYCESFHNFSKMHGFQWRIQKFPKGGHAPEREGTPLDIAKNSRILGLTSLASLTFDGKFQAKRGRPDPLPPSKFATAFQFKSNVDDVSWVM